MRGIPLEEVPGVLEHRRRESVIRDAAFLDLPTNVAGFTVTQVTLRKWLILRIAGNPLLAGGVPTPEDLAQFLWVMSPQYNPTGRGRSAFLRECRRRFMAPRPPVIRTKLRLYRWTQACEARVLEAHRIVSASRDFLSHQFQDFPGGAGGVSYYSDAAGLCMAFRDRFTEAQMLDRPVNKIFQDLKVLQDMKGLPLGNPSDKIVHAWIAARRAAKERN